MQRTDYVNVNTKQVLVSNIADSVQAKDLSLPPNCNGLGRVHTFKRNIENWGDDPLPICPAIKALGLQDNLSSIKTQVFQVGYCNMKCWYCFVPDELKNGTQGELKRVDELMELFLAEPDRPKVIDLSGGNPELVPEWILWFMEELIKKNLEKDYYLWSDDTLSTKSMFDFLTKKEIDFMASYKNYGKACCFKGFDEYSYEFNSKFNKTNYFTQFDLIRRYINSGFDTYGYITLTTNDISDVAQKISKFIDLAQNIHEELPLRIIPLKIFMYTPTEGRMTDIYQNALKNQEIVVAVWKEEIDKRFNLEQKTKNICELMKV